MKKPNLSPVKVQLDKERTLRFTMRSVLALNEELGRNVLGKEGLFDDDNNICLKSVAAALAHGLRADDSEMTTERVLDMVDVRQLAELAEKIAEAFGAQGDGADRPTKAQAE